jgi:hypothetical protein
LARPDWIVLLLQSVELALEAIEDRRIFGAVFNDDFRNQSESPPKVT